jgi:hypothetical protein
MQSGQRLDGRDDGRGIPGRAGSRLGWLRLRCELRCRVGLVLRGLCRARSFGGSLRTYLRPVGTSNRRRRTARPVPGHVALMALSVKQAF